MAYHIPFFNTCDSFSCPLCPLLACLTIWLSFFLSVLIYLFWFASVFKVIASCMGPDSAMVTAGIKPSVKIIMAPSWWDSQCCFHSGGIPGALPLPWKCLIIAESPYVIQFAPMSHFPEAPCFVMADWESYVCGEWSHSHTSEYVYKVITFTWHVCACFSCSGQL